MSPIKYGMPANPFDDLPETPREADLYTMRKQIEMQNFTITALQKEPDELKELYRWHSVEADGLPEESGEYQVYGLFSENFDPEVCSSSYNVGGYYEPPTWWVYGTVIGAVYLEGCDITIKKAATITHWRKMPDYKPEQGE